MRIEHWLYKLPLRLRSLFKRNRVEQELDEELRFHIEQQIEQGTACGLSAKEARYAALRAMHGVEQRKEECRDARRVNLLDSLIQDLRYGLRVLRNSPGFTITALLSLALGIGANTAIFQLLDAVRLRTLPVANPQQLAEIRIANPDLRTGNFSGPYDDMTNPLFEQVRKEQHAFSGVFAWGTDMMDTDRDGELHTLRALWVSSEFFPVLQVAPVLGRVISSADDRRGCGSPAAVISYAFWQREFGANPAVLGQRLMLHGHPFEVIGVTPPGFFGVSVGQDFDVAIPLCAVALFTGVDNNPLDRRDNWWLMVMGRFKPGWSVAQASSHLAAISPGVFEATPLTGYQPGKLRDYLKLKLQAVPASTGVSSLRDQYENSLWLLFATSGTVLFIACANLASLMLARATAREKEIAVRLALGASRRRVIGQLLAESVLLAVSGAIAGICLAQVLSRFLVSSLNTKYNPSFLDLRMDWRVLAFTAGIGVMTCILFGLIPAFRATRITPSSAMKAAGRGLTATRERFGLRRVLVVTQIALSLVLLVGALLFIRSFYNLATVDTGFRTDGVLIARLDLSRANLSPDQRPRLMHDLLEAVHAVPGVQSVTTANNIPLLGSSWTLDLETNGSGEPHKGSSRFNWVSPGYFSTMGIPLLDGRDFNAADTPASVKVAIVNELFARKVFPGVNPSGQTFRTVAEPGYPATLYQIVGLVKNTKYSSLRQEFQPIVFVPDSQQPNPHQWATLLIRSSIARAALTAAVRKSIRTTNPAIRMEFGDFTQEVQQRLTGDRLMAALSGFFGFLAALLAAIGLYGVISYLVARRRNEIGIRMALGAGRSRVLRMMMAEAALLTGIGLAVGILLALITGRAAATMLFGLRPSDPVTLLAAVVALAVIAALASYLPAQRATRVDPMVALRDE